MSRFAIGCRRQFTTEAVMDKLLTTKEAARYLGMSDAFLERDRWTGDPKIPFVRVGSRSVRYEREALDAYVRGRGNRMARGS